MEHSENKKVDLVNRKMISFVTINDVSGFLLFLTMISPCGCGFDSTGSVRLPFSIIFSLVTHCSVR